MTLEQMAFNGWKTLNVQDLWPVPFRNRNTKCQELSSSRVCRHCRYCRYGNLWWLAMKKLASWRLSVFSDNPSLIEAERRIWVNKLTINGSDNGLSPGRRQAIIWTNAEILFIPLLGRQYSEILIEIHIFILKKKHLKMSSAKWWPFCFGLNVKTVVFGFGLLRLYNQFSVGSRDGFIYTFQRCLVARIEKEVLSYWLICRLWLHHKLS